MCSQVDQFMLIHLLRMFPPSQTPLADTRMILQTTALLAGAKGKMCDRGDGSELYSRTTRERATGLWTDALPSL